MKNILIKNLFNYKEPFMQGKGSIDFKSSSTMNAKKSLYFQEDMKGSLKNQK